MANKNKELLSPVWNNWDDFLMSPDICVLRDRPWVFHPYDSESPSLLILSKPSPPGLVSASKTASSGDSANSLTSFSLEKYK